MPRKDQRGRLIAKLRLDLQELGGDRGVNVRFHGNTNDRLLVELNERPYLVLIPDTAQLLTVSGVKRRLASWPGLAGREAAGHVVLAPNAPLARSLLEAGRHQLPSGTVVVGRWGTTNELAVSSLTPDLALILDAAGVRSNAHSDGNGHRPANADRLSGSVPLAGQRNLRPGTRIDNYRLDRRLGRGHSAEVWKAELVAPTPGVELPAGSTVALKVYFPSLLQGFETLRIQREFSVASSLSHPSLARVYDLLLAPSRPFHAFMAMEFVDGPSLKAVIEKSGPRSTSATLSIASQLFGALAEIRSEGALHRDVKAANIMLASTDTDAPIVKLVDLGIVSLPAEDHFTAASVFLGSKHSAPIEQLTGTLMDERTDIYAAGCVLFHCLQGVPPYHNTGPEGAIVAQMLARPERLPSKGRSTVDTELADFVNSCMNVQAADRPSTAMECVQAIGRIQARSR